MNTDWIKKHEILLIAILFLSTILFLGNRWINSSARNADQQLAVAQQMLKEQQQVNAENEKRSQQALASMQEAYARLEQQNAVLTGAIAARNNELQKQKEVDKTLPLPDLLVRWEQLAKLNKDDLSNTTKGITISEQGARTTVATLEEVPVLNAAVEDQKQIIANKDTEISKATDAVNALNTQVGGLKTEIQKEKDLCTAQTKDIKANNRKSKRNWFITGLVAGGTVALKLAGVF